MAATKDTVAPGSNSESCPPEVLDWEPDSLVELDRSTFINSLRGSPLGSSAGPGGCAYEHLKLLLDESDATELLVAACNLSRKAKFQKRSGRH